MRFEIYRGEDNEFYWRLWYVDETIATGHQSFPAPENCVGQIKLVKLCGDADIEILHNY